MARHGTSNFTSVAAALTYYRSQGNDYTRGDVMQKVIDGEISLGAPALKEGERCVIDADNRYHIEVQAK